MKLRSISLLLVLCLALSGCSAASQAMGTLGIPVDDVASVTLTASSGATTTTQDNKSIRSVVDLLNRLTLENGTDGASTPAYTFTVTGRDGAVLAAVGVLDKNTVTYDGKTFSVKADQLLFQAQRMECATMTDKELIQILFESDYLDDLTILDDEGRVSLDKITRLKENFPALFEILGRPSAVESLGSYGIGYLRTYLNSDDLNLRERAEKIAQYLSAALPDLKTAIEEVLETTTPKS